MTTTSTPTTTSSSTVVTTTAITMVTSCDSPLTGVDPLGGGVVLDGRLSALDGNGRVLEGGVGEGESVGLLGPGTEASERGGGESEERWMDTHGAMQCGFTCVCILTITY